MVIDHAAGVPAGRSFSKKEIGQAKALASVSDNDITATVKFMLSADPAWWSKKPILPSAVAEHLPVYRRNQANGAPVHKSHIEWQGDPA